jgi:hypothetical protein
MDGSLVVVDGLAVADGEELDLREEAWGIALDQRAFGPRRLVVAFGDCDGRMRYLAHVRRTDPPELGLEPCIRLVGQGMALAIAFCDERVVEGPPPPDVADRFAYAQSIADEYGIHLVDWIACDSLAFRSFRLALHPDEPWWNVP